MNCHAIAHLLGQSVRLALKVLPSSLFDEKQTTLNTFGVLQCVSFDNPLYYRSIDLALENDSQPSHIVSFELVNSSHAAVACFGLPIIMVI